ncbi:hypothetical protein [Natronincola ferrireducens]|uniref:Uncharacterized protein n=1 Tax=Natronincola ferrireducens TaxID=393762 RepID=A0A1G9D7Q9_9FIRM|nr:hypothetical protein [Natronincola ferrireducens]SDK59754.1 hypothetical protein SAMN05660472_01665 [Natronincola ferrireducens]
MNTLNQYRDSPEINPLILQNIEEKQSIHQFEDKTFEIHVEKLKGKKKVSEIR